MWLLDLALKSEFFSLFKPKIPFQPRKDSFDQKAVALACNLPMKSIKTIAIGLK